MAYYYINSCDQDYPVNYPYYNQPYYSDHHSNHNYYSSSSYDDQYGYGGYSDEQYPIRYDQNHYYNTQFHSNPYQHIPSQSLIVYQYASAYDHSESSPKKGSNFIDPISTTGFVVSYSNADTDPKTDLGFEEYNPEPFQGGYDMSETYGKPLPPSEEICYPPSKSDPTPPPPSPYGKGEHNLDTPPVKDQQKTLEDDEDQASELDEDEEDDHDGSEDDDDDGEEEELEEEENYGVLIAPPLPGKEDQSIDQGGTKPANGNHGGSIAPPLPGKKEQSIDQGGEKSDNGSFVHEQAREEEDASKSEEEEEEEEEQEQEHEKRDYNWDEGRVEEKEPVRKIPPGYALEALDLCEGVFGGYFPCLRKRNQGNAGDQEGSSSTVSTGNDDANGDCLKTTMNYLFGDPDPYARAMPDPIYGYQRYYPQQPICEQVEYGGNYTWSDNPSYYGYNGGGYY